MIQKMLKGAIIIVIVCTTLYAWSQNRMDLTDVQLKNIEALSMTEEDDCNEWQKVNCYFRFSEKPDSEPHYTCIESSSAGALRSCGNIENKIPVWGYVTGECLICLH